MLSLLKSQSFRSPFPHFISTQIFPPAVHQAILAWLMGEKSWKLRETDFYEQHEFTLQAVSPPPQLAFLTAPAFLTTLRIDIGRLLSAEFTERTEVCAHKLVPGQRIGIHNDYIPGGETHRLLIQLTATKEPEAGGLLMFFNNQDARDVSKVFRSAGNSAVGFAIGPQSHHAVSKQHQGERFTLVYSFFSSSNAA